MIKCKKVIIKVKVFFNLIKGNLDFVCLDIEKLFFII